MATKIIGTNLGYIGAGVGGLALGTAAGFGASSLLRNRKAKRSKNRNKRKRNYSHHRKRKKKTHHYTSHRRIHYTKKGQPYIILGSGKARFIKKKSARTSRKRKGGRY